MRPDTRTVILILGVLAFILGLVYLGRGDFAREAWGDIWGVISG